ncbi:MULTISPECIES: hypothetical protein [Streptomyces]|uniref:hypothetical protein n=1 Tax=Streptomyces TaxID=1883 RepID=UPI00345C45B9
MRHARTRLGRTLLGALGAAALIGTAVTGPATAASAQARPTAASSQISGFGPDVLADKARPPAPAKPSDAKASARHGNDCSPSSLKAKAAKAQPLNSSAPSELRGKKMATCVTFNEPDARLNKESAKARDAALNKARTVSAANIKGRDLSSLKAAKLKAGNGIAKQSKSILDLPQYCYDRKFQGWAGYRNEQCRIDDVTLYFFDVSDKGAPVWIGTAKALEYDFVYTSDIVDKFAHQIRVSKYWGERSGNNEFASFISGMSWCDGDCKPERDTGLRPGQFVKDVNNDGEAFYDSTRGEPGGIGFNHSFWEWNAEVFPFIPAAPVVIEAPQVRCDNAFDDDGNNSGDPAFVTRATVGAGCVFNGVMPVMIYSKSGAYPTLARHIGAAQASGLPGAYPNGAVLTRLTNKYDKRRNGDTACPSKWVRPNLKSCDEYPFRSSYQGAYTQTPKGTGRTFAPPNISWCEMDPRWGVPVGVTGPTGWSSCMIPATENSRGGSALGAFYKTNRVLDKDAYQVWIQ